MFLSLSNKKCLFLLVLKLSELFDKALVWKFRLLNYFAANGLPENLNCLKVPTLGDNFCDDPICGFCAVPGTFLDDDRGVRLIGPSVFLGKSS